MPVDSIKDVSENTFVPEVIEKSKEKIVIVDFLGSVVWSMQGLDSHSGKSSNEKEGTS